jgi:hypothetical protein
LELTDDLGEEQGACQDQLSVMSPTYKSSGWSILRRLAGEWAKIRQAALS